MKIGNRILDISVSNIFFYDKSSGQRKQKEK